MAVIYSQILRVSKELDLQGARARKKKAPRTKAAIATTERTPSVHPKDASWQSGHPGLKMRRGGFDEPYCSDKCYEAAGSRIFNWYRHVTPNVLTPYVCAFCRSQRGEAPTDRPRAIFPYREKLMAACTDCEEEVRIPAIMIASSGDRDHRFR